jgi:hypothetical protein
VLNKFFAGVCTLALAAVAAGCSADTTANSNAAGSGTTAQMRTAPDNSEISTETADGVTIETRTFKDPNSRIEKVVVTTRGGKRTARVYYRDKTTKDLPDNDVERALSATGDALVTAGSTVADKVEDIPSEADDAARAVGDKAEDVGGAVVDGAKKVGSEVGDKSEDVGRATAKGAKKVGSEVADKAEDVGGATVNGAKKVGKGTAKGAKKVGGKIKDAVTP